MNNKLLTDTPWPHFARGIPSPARNKRLAFGQRHRRFRAAHLRDRPGATTDHVGHCSPPRALLRHVGTLLARIAGAL